MPAVFDHIALAVPDLTVAPAFLVGELGGVSGYGGPSGDFSWWHWDYDGGGRIEVIEPDGPPGGFVDRHLAARGPGIHHVNFEVESLKQKSTRAEELGFSVVGYHSDEHWSEAFLHPKSAMGIVVQLVESTHNDHEHDSAEWEAWKSRIVPPPAPENPPPPVAIAGLRMRTADRDAALRQWGELLGGELDERPGELLFRWPGSSMRVAVTIEDGAPSEPAAIEVRAERSLALHPGPHPKLGARFLQLRDGE